MASPTLSILLSIYIAKAKSRSFIDYVLGEVMKNGGLFFFFFFLVVIVSDIAKFQVWPR